MNGEPRKEHHKGKWEQVVQKATRSLQEMLRAASQRRRNVIIDQVREMSFVLLHDKHLLLINKYSNSIISWKLLGIPFNSNCF